MLLLTPIEHMLNVCKNYLLVHANREDVRILHDGNASSVAKNMESRYSATYQLIKQFCLLEKVYSQSDVEVNGWDTFDQRTKQVLRFLGEDIVHKALGDKKGLPLHSTKNSWAFNTTVCSALRHAINGKIQTPTTPAGYQRVELVSSPPLNILKLIQVDNIHYGEQICSKILKTVVKPLTITRIASQWKRAI
ncbi:hypothetical protein G6F56_011887 [Rhizopus delemar]|nr:hypothetical protein G6F56_011887 [Rhizopus delemar]